MRTLWLGLTVAFLGSLPARAENPRPLLLQRPTLSKTQVVFGFAGDLWAVGREGGEARRLTGGVGRVFNPVFSPDGSQVAYSGEYEGNLDVYVIPATGGESRRLTYHPAGSLALGWTPDGKNILFSSTRTSYAPFRKLFTVPVTGGLPTELPLPMGVQGAFSPDGKQLAYLPFSNRSDNPNIYRAWKRYRGGLASPVWIADLADSRITKVPREDSNDSCPLWFEGKLYFLSDRDGPTTLFSYDPASRLVKKELENRGYDLISASVGPDAIVYEQFGSLHTLDPRTGKTQEIHVSITSDFPQVRPHRANVAKKIVQASLSPNGARVAFEARGEILTAPAEKGDVRNLTETPGAAERDPAWSPDGKTVAYFSDESGEYLLHLRDARGAGPVKRIPLGDGPNVYFEPVWSPDNTRIAYRDTRDRLWVTDVVTAKSTLVDRHTYEIDSSFDVSWSPDSRWLAYAKFMDNRLYSLFLHDQKDGRNHRITDALSDARFPAFDRSGKYLYFAASTDVGPTTNAIDMSGMNHAVTRDVYLIVLDKKAPSPLAPESDEEKEKQAEANEKAPDKEEPAHALDLEKIQQRIVSLPVPSRNYNGLKVGKAGTLFLLEAPEVLLLALNQSPAPPRVTVQKFDLESRKTGKVLDGVNHFHVAANGEKLLYQQGEQWFIKGVGGEPATALKLDDMEVFVDPRAEWRQMYREAWRLQRDFLYDPHYHGLDLAAAEKQYAVFLDGIAHRSDLNYLFNEMLGQLTLGHLFVAGGDAPEVKPVQAGLLGADFRVDKERYQFARIYSGVNWWPQLRAPLTQPGVNVQEGEYLLAVQGKELRGADDVDRALENTAGKAVTIRVGPSPDGKDSRDVRVVPVPSDSMLRHLAWVEGNRQRVEALGKGKLAYIYLPNTSVQGFKNFNRYFFAQVEKQGAVIDERFNGGGYAADYVIDYLRRPVLNYWATREGKISRSPGGAIPGPKAMIINESAGSGGDLMPWYFRQTGLGPLVGKRTWGGLVGFGNYPPLLDGGLITAPNFAFFTPGGAWEVENRGVAPDVEVEHDPYEVRAGRDPQLEKAVELVLEALKKNPPPQPKLPAYPNYHRQEKAPGGSAEKK